LDRLFEPEGLLSSASALRLEDVPEEVREHAARVVADTIGVAMGGGRRAEITSFIRGSGPLFPPLAGGAATLVVPGFPGTDPATAAFVNATAGTFLELDEGYRPTGHPAVHVVPAALAAAQALRATGREFLAAVLGGYEVVARLFEAYRLTYPLHPHGHFGAVGAAVAVARLRGADPIEPAAIAATLPLLPVWQPCYEGATVRNAYAGTASAVGVSANRMSVAGFTGSRTSQRVAFGELVGEPVAPEVLDGSVDPARLRITRNYMKLHSACALSHSALDAVLALGPLAVEEIAGIEVETVSNNMKIARQAQRNDLSTRFSMPYAVAAAVVHGHTRPEAFLPDERVFVLAERVSVRAAEDLEQAWPDASPVRVTVRLRDGVYSERVDNPHGYHADPARPDELRTKFEMLNGDAGHLYDRLLGVEKVDDVATLFEGAG
jgi:2-methylcitrate dehydratase PrpD